MAGDGAPHVKVYDGVTGQERLSFFAFDTAYLGGVTLAFGDLNGDGRAEIIVGATSGVSHVKVFDGLTGAELSSFFAYTNQDGTPTPSGVSVAAGDLDGDGRAEIVTGANSIAPHVKVFNAAGATLNSFFAFDPSLFTGGISIAAADLNGDGIAEIVAGTTSGGTSRLTVIYQNEAPRGPITLANDRGTNPGVSIGDINGDGRRELIATVGPTLNFFDGISLGQIGSAVPYANYNGNVFVGA